MRRVRLPLLLAALATTSGCATSVHVDFDPDEDFSGYRTWAWLQSAWEVPAQGRAVDPGLDALVRVAIARELAARGYEPAGETAPDVLVTYRLEVRRQLVRGIEPRALQTVYSHHQQGGFEVLSSQPTLQLYEIGTLVLDIAEGRERQLVWRGIGTRRVPTSFKRRAEEVVAEILERFPPESGSGS